MRRGRSWRRRGTARQPWDVSDSVSSTKASASRLSMSARMTQRAPFLNASTANTFRLRVCDLRAGHEIYLSDPRRTDAAKLRTILRQPVEPL